MKNYPLLLVFAILLFSCNSQKNQPKASLEGSWELVSISGTKNAFQDLYPNSKPSITFDLKENRVSGKNGCNSYSGKFTLDGNKIRFEPGTMIATKMFCEGGGESAYMTALGKVDSFLVSDDGTHLELTAGNLSVLQFKKSYAAPIKE